MTRNVNLNFIPSSIFQESQSISLFSAVFEPNLRRWRRKCKSFHRFVFHLTSFPEDGIPLSISSAKKKIRSAGIAICLSERSLKKLFFKIGADHGILPELEKYSDFGPSTSSFSLPPHHQSHPSTLSSPPKYHRGRSKKPSKVSRILCRSWSGSSIKLFVEAGASTKSFTGAGTSSGILTGASV